MVSPGCLAERWVVSELRPYNLVLVRFAAFHCSRFVVGSFMVRQQAAVFNSACRGKQVFWRWGSQCRFSSLRHIYVGYDGRLTFGLPLLPSGCQSYKSLCPRFHVVAQTWRQPKPRWNIKLHTEEPQRQGEIRRLSNIVFFFASKLTLLVRTIEREGIGAKRWEAKGYSAPTSACSVPVQSLYP